VEPPLVTPLFQPLMPEGTPSLPQEAESDPFRRSVQYNCCQNVTVRLGARRATLAGPGCATGTNSSARNRPATESFRRRPESISAFLPSIGAAARSPHGFRPAPE